MGRPRPLNRASVCQILPTGGVPGGMTFRRRRSFGPLVALFGALAACSSAVEDTKLAEQELTDAGERPPARDAGTTDDGASPSPIPALEANDVSILWPVPRTGELPAGYLKLAPQSGERGPGIPAAALEAIPDLHADLPRSAVLAAAVVVAMRVDPCAPSLTDTCVRELRLSVEPLAPSLEDTALHLIYELDEARFAALLQDLQRLRAKSPVATSGPLRVHPGLQAGGIASAFAGDVHEVVVRYATEAELVRVTVNSFAFDNWGFARVDRTTTGWQRVDIPGLPEGTSSQSWLRQAQQDSLDDPSGTITPTPATTFAALLAASSLASGPNTTEVLTARDAILDFEHPGRTNARANDCASCHLAGAAHLWAAKRGVSFDTSGRYVPPPGFDSTIDVPPELDGNLSNTIAFGWHRVRHDVAVPSVSARVAAETAEVLKKLQAL